MPNESASATTPASLDIPSLMRRYRDAYRVAAAIILFGRILKVLGIILGAAVAISGIAFMQLHVAYTSVQNIYQLGGFIVGAIIWLFLHVVGIIISGQGQGLRASLDEAVWVCPFLTDDQRAKTAALQRR